MYCGTKLLPQSDAEQKSKITAVIAAVLTAAMFLVLSIIFVVRAGIFSGDDEEDIYPTYEPVKLHTPTPLPTQVPAWVLGTAEPTSAPIPPTAVPQTAPPAVTAEPDNASGASGGEFIETAESYTARHPQYNTYMNNMYNFSCKYPAHFIEESDDDSLFAVRASDNSAILTISAQYAEGKTTQELLDELLMSADGTIERSSFDANSLSVFVREDGVCYNLYGKLNNGNICFFIFGYDEALSDIYASYAFVIEDSFTVY